jgi:hypothetical protein
MRALPLASGRDWYRAPQQLLDRAQPFTFVAADER